MGGGSGGHITPIVAIVDSLRHSGLDPESSNCDGIASKAKQSNSALTAASDSSLHHRTCVSKTSYAVEPVEPYSSKSDKSVLEESEPIGQVRNIRFQDANLVNDDEENCPGALAPSKNLDIRVWVDKKFASQTRQLLDNKTRVDVIASGKLRRYTNLTFWHRWFSWYHLRRTHLPNFMDFFKIVGGFIQSFFKLVFWRPDVIFCKGGYVCLPVGLAAHALKIPLVIHDSDTVPGLTNRVLARFATAIGTGAPVENYPGYPKSKTKFVGIPVRPEFKHLDEKERESAKKHLGLDSKKPLIFATGGGLGATELNAAVAKNAAEIIKNDTQILLLTGKGKTVDVPSDLKKDFVTKDFLTDDFALATSAADIAVVRAGATSMAELAAVGAAVIIIPSPYLSGDHQTKNAAVYGKAEAAVVLNQKELDQEPELLAKAILELLNDKDLHKKLGQNLAKFARPNALQEMVDMILKAAK